MSNDFLIVESGLHLTNFYIFVLYPQVMYLLLLNVFQVYSISVTLLFSHH